MFGCEIWTTKKIECQRIDALDCGAAEDSFESPSGYKEFKPVKCKGNQPWILIGRTDAEAEAPILWPPDAKCWLIRKDPNAGKDWRQEKGTREDEMVGWHHCLNGYEFKLTQLGAIRLEFMKWLIRKDPDAGKDWRQEKGTTEDEMVGWHHWLDEHEFE